MRNKQIAREPLRGSRDLFVPHFDSFPMNREKNAVLVRFVCSALRFISHEPRKKDTHSLSIHCTCSVYANYIGLSVMTNANELGPVKGSLYVMIKLLKMTDVS